MHARVRPAVSEDEIVACIVVGVIIVVHDAPNAAAAALLATAAVGAAKAGEAKEEAKSFTFTTLWPKEGQKKQKYTNK